MGWETVVDRIRFWRSSRILGSCLVLFCIIPMDASACRPSDEARTFFSVAPTDIDAPVIVRITIVELIRDNLKRVFIDGDDKLSFVGLARINQAIKGQISENEIIKVISPNTSCYREFSLGSTGVVLGELQRNTDGKVELVLKGFPSRHRPIRNAN